MAMFLPILASLFLVRLLPLTSHFNHRPGTATIVCIFAAFRVAQLLSFKYFGRDITGFPIFKKFGNCSESRFMVVSSFYAWAGVSYMALLWRYTSFLVEERYIP